MLNEQNNYRSILKIELADRVAHNPAYSLRAMARQVGLSPSLLSDVMKGKKNLSVDSAMQVAQGLRFSENECEYFALLVQMDALKSPELRAVFQERMNRLKPQAPRYDLSLDVFRVVGDWYHFAILELTNTQEFELSAQTASQALDISRAEAEAAIDRLVRLELLEKSSEGHWRKSQAVLTASSNLPNEALRKYHAQTLRLATVSLATQTPQEKIVGSETFAFDKEQMQQANQIIEKCFADMTLLARSGAAKSSVYHLGIQFFRLSKEKIKEQ